MTRFLSPMIAFLAAFLAGPATAAETGTSLDNLRQTQSSVYAIVREFHMQTLLSGDPGRTAQLKAAVGKGGSALDRVTGDGNAALETALKESRAAWAAFAKLSLANNIAADGYTDDNLIGELYAAAEALDAALTKAIKAVPAGKSRALSDRAHAANLLMQRTVASYLKRGAQMSPDVGSEETFDLGEATKTLDKEMTALSRELKGNPAMPGVYSKWNFIRGSLANYNEKAVPFIVDRYAAQINEGLVTVARSLDAK